MGKAFLPETVEAGALAGMRPARDPFAQAPGADSRKAQRQGPGEPLGIAALVIPAEALEVTVGAGAGEAIGLPDSVLPGDVYRYCPDVGTAEMWLTLEAAGGYRIAPGSPVGRAGGVLAPAGRLTLMADGGGRVDLLPVPQADRLWLLPLAPLRAGADYTLIAASPEPGAFTVADHACVAFVRGTMIRMADGSERPVETLEPGDRVLTRDSGAQRLRWRSSRQAPAHGYLAPVRIAAGALGNAGDLLVGPHHRLLLSDWRAEVMLGSREVLVRAVDLVDGSRITRREGGLVEYHHLVFDSHEIVYAEGLPAESLHLTPVSLEALPPDARSRIVELFPDLHGDRPDSAVTSRMSLKSYEAKALLKQVGFR